MACGLRRKTATARTQIRDTDNDGLDDAYEVGDPRFNPLNPDSDGDGVVDGVERRSQIQVYLASQNSFRLTVLSHNFSSVSLQC